MYTQVSPAVCTSYHTIAVHSFIIPEYIKLQHISRYAIVLNYLSLLYFIEGWVFVSKKLSNIRKGIKDVRKILPIFDPLPVHTAAPTPLPPDVGTLARKSTLKSYCHKNN